jgi:hypothetical protein
VERSTSGIYKDPADLIWLSTAARLGIQIRRSDETYASWDGARTLTLCTPAAFDPDDSLAQLILHELCHALVQGPAGRRRVDWGLDNVDDDAAAVEEHACHRLQAALLDRHGLREVLAVTTSWRSYWEALPEDPLGAGDDPAIARARAAWPDAVRGPWAQPIEDALRATAALAAAVAPFAPPDSVWRRARPQHPLGGAVGPVGHSCGDCAWGATGRCVARAEEGGEGPGTVDSWPACFRWQASLSCGDCGACCREGYHLAPVEPDEALYTARPDLLVHDADGAALPRPGGRCVGLAAQPGWRCAIYALRPRACSELEPGGEGCLIARRRVGLSRP